MEPISGIIFGIICAIVADSRGRSGIGWFFGGLFFSCFALILLLVLPDLKIMEESENQLTRENRRLREQIRRDRAVADERYSETMYRIDMHDEQAHFDSNLPPALSLENLHQIDGPTESDSDGYELTTWWYADPKEAQQIGPVTFDNMRQLWRAGTVQKSTLVWCDLFGDWEQVADIWDLEERLNA